MAQRFCAYPARFSFAHNSSQANSSDGSKENVFVESPKPDMQLCPEVLGICIIDWGMKSVFGALEGSSSSIGFVRALSKMDSETCRLSMEKFLNMEADLDPRR